MLRCLARAFPLCIPALMALAVAAPPVSSPKLVYQTALGAGALSLAVDSQGYAYVGGSRTGCAFLTKINQAGTAVVWSVCLPLSQASAVALDAAGYVYVTGLTPATGPGYSSQVIKLSPDGQQTVYSTSIGTAISTALAVDQSGNAYVTGTAGVTFQATPGAYITSGFGAFALKLSANGTVAYATYLDLLSGSGIAVDSQGQAWVAGTACPPVARETVSNCQTDSYGVGSGVRKLDAQGAALLVSKTFGGGPAGDQGIVSWDGAYGVGVDTTDSIWIVGSVESAGIPTTPGSVQPKRSGYGSNGSGGIGYAVKFSPSGDVLAGTYLGSNPGGPDLTISSVTIDGQGRPYFALNMPSGPTSFDCTGTASALVMALAPDASAVVARMPLSSPVLAVALDGNGGLYTAGSSLNNSGSAAKFDLTVSGPVPPQLGAFLNAAGFQNVPGALGVAPGELLTIFGTNLPQAPKVTFGANVAPILYADANQINLVVPFGVEPPVVTVSVEGAGSCLAPVLLASPALFTADDSGTGQLAALNQDGSVNSGANPAKAGAVVSVFLTGAGAMMPPLADGQLGPLQPPYPAPVLAVSADVNNVSVPVLFAGQAPLLVAGVVQVNLQIPENTGSGNAGVSVTLGPVKGRIYQSFGGTVAISGAQ